MEENNIIKWTPTTMLEITLNEPDDFLKVRETLTRIGVASRKENKLFQSCHILHKQGRYFIVHFKELFLLDGKKSNLEMNDIARRNTIATLLSDWGLVNIVSKDIGELAQLRQIKIIPIYKAKGDVADPDWFYHEILVPLKVNLALEHLERESLAFDLKILSQTIWMLTLGRWWPIKENPEVSQLKDSIIRKL